MVVSGNVDLLLACDDLSEQHRSLLHQIRQAGTSGAELARQLLVFGRRESLLPQLVDLTAVVARFEPMLRRVLTENVEVVTELRDDLRPVRADRGEMEQVLMNLVVNARDAMPAGGRLTVRTANAEAPPPAESGESTVGVPLGEGPLVLLEVSDTGLGMDAATLTHIFDPFFTTKSEGLGTGLGLATVQRIAKRSGGRVQVVSAPNRGTTFRVFLPAHVGEEKPFDDEAPAPVTLQQGSETVLVVEDQEPVRRLVVLSLERLGYRVLEASSVAEARRCIATAGDDFDLLLTDVVLSDGTGIDLATELEAARPDACVLLMSGYAGETTIPEAHGRLRDYLQKPFSLDELGRRVRRILDRA